MLKSIFLWIWCFPQMLVGLIVKLVTGAEKKDDHYVYDGPGSVSLGEYIFLYPRHWDDETVLRHERGHRTQSRILGWLYLFVIGLPSVIWNTCFRGYRYKHKVDYYSFYTEKWADKLGGVER